MKILEQLFSLKGKVIIVFGGGGQIGFELSKSCALAGAKVYIADYDVEQAEKKMVKIEEDEISSQIEILQVDVCSETSVESIYQQIDKKSGQIDGIVNSFHFKGDSRNLDTKSSFFMDLEDYPLDMWNKVHEVNLTGVFLTCREAISYFKKSHGGVIVNISSTYGNVSPNKTIYQGAGINSPVSYASSKAGIINLSRYFATHLAEYNIRVNVLSPGGVFNSQDEEFVKEYSRLTPLNRMANSDEYSGAVIYMLSNSASYLTGANIIVDGGWTSW